MKLRHLRHTALYCIGLGKALRTAQHIPGYASRQSNPRILCINCAATGWGRSSAERSSSCSGHLEKARIQSSLNGEANREEKEVYK